MNASDVRHASSDMSKTVIDAAADFAAKAHEGASAALAGARATADEVGPGCPASRQPAPYELPRP